MKSTILPSAGAVNWNQTSLLTLSQQAGILLSGGGGAGLKISDAVASTLPSMT